jgi:hypothetical protein
MKGGQSDLSAEALDRRSPPSGEGGSVPAPFHFCCRGHGASAPLPALDPVRAAAQHQDKSNDLIQTDFNFPVQACGIRTADKRP